MICLAPASNAQVRIWLDERSRFASEKPVIVIYNMPFAYRVYDNRRLSVQQLKQALEMVVQKHESLRTALIFDGEENQLVQRIIDGSHNNTPLFQFNDSTYDTDEQLNTILQGERRNSQLFDLARGLVFRCHFVHHQTSLPNNCVCAEDIIIFNFHHASFDFPSMEIFLHDLNEAYSTGQLATDHDTHLRYLDC